MPSAEEQSFYEMARYIILYWNGAVDKTLFVEHLPGQVIVRNYYECIPSHVLEL